MVLEVIYRTTRPGCPEELFYANDLALISETLEDLNGRLETWKGSLESKGLRINVRKTKMMISSENARNKVRRRQVSLCCLQKGVGRNSILCQFCKWWVHKRCIGIRG